MVELLEANLEVINALGSLRGHMLSLVDLIERGTIPLELTAYLIDGMQNGASVLIGALPRGAGKTTLMAALLGVIPSSDRVIPIEYASMIQELTPGTQENPKTYVIHEIARGNSWGRYLWGSPVIEVTRLVDQYTRLVTTLHASSVEGVKATFRRLGDEKAMNVFNFIIFIQYNYSNSLRVVDEVWELDTSKKFFKLVYCIDKEFAPDIKNKPNHQKWKNFVSKCLNQNMYTLAEVAYALREF